MNLIVRRAAISLAALSSFAAFAESASSLLPLARGGFVPQRVLVKYKTAALQREVLAEMALPIQSFGAQSQMGAIQRLRAVSSKTDLLRFSSSTTVRDVVADLNADSRVEWAQPDYYLSIFSNPEKIASASETLQALNAGFAPLMNTSSSLFARTSSSEASASTNSNPIFDRPNSEAPEGRGDVMKGDLWGMLRVGAERTWGTQRGSRQVLVADIDTGVDYNHEDLRHNMWEGVGYDFADKDAFPWDTHGHGTHTSGTIGATGGNGIGVSGVVQKANIMAVRFIGSNGYGTTSDAILSIDYSVKNGAKVLSNSWGGAPEEDDQENVALLESIQRADAADVLFVAAAGNDGKNNDERPVYPAAMQVPNIITVASTNDGDRRSFFSNYGVKTVHVGAPGSNILSTVPGNQYLKNSGTSMACPHVAGLAALVLSERPDLSAHDVKQIIMESVSPLASLQGITVTGGIINTSAALERARTFGN